MRRRAACVWLVLAAAPAYGHRLSVDFVRRGDAITIEVFHPEDGSPAAGARVRVSAAGGLVASGDTNERGAFEFRTAEPGPFEVEAVIAGHRATCVIEAAAGPDGAVGAGSRIRGEPAPIVQVVAGLGAIFGLFGFLLALRTARAARRIAARLSRIEEERPRAS
ncbi:MAG TPA: hypothetical protein DCM87_21565 [Planctomycetes bacterium]|nr:hypothetical protein [Planctomycetota bacterium]